MDGMRKRFQTRVTSVLLSVILKVTLFPNKCGAIVRALGHG